MEVRDSSTVVEQYGENKLPQRITRDEKERARDILQAVFDNGKASALVPSLTYDEPDGGPMAVPDCKRRGPAAPCAHRPRHAPASRCFL